MKEVFMVEAGKRTPLPASHDYSSLKPRHTPTRLEQPRFLFQRKSHPKIASAHTPLPSHKQPKKPAPSAILISRGEMGGREAARVPHKQCWSERNLGQKSSKRLGNYRKSNSIAEIKPQESPVCSHKRKLSLVQPAANLSQQHYSLGERLNVTTWLILVRKMFVEEERRRGQNVVRVEALIDYLHRLQREGLDTFNAIVEPFEQERQLSKAQLIAHLANFLPKQGSVSYSEVLHCLTQQQHSQSSSKEAARPRHKPSYSDESHEEGVETARFQEGSAQDPRKQRNKPKNPTQSSWEKENRRLFVNEYRGGRQKKGVKGAVEPFMGVGQRRDGGVYAGEAIGMLTLQGRSPREVMESQMFQSMQQWRTNGHANNVSFNEEAGDAGQASSAFQQQVASLEDILRKVRSIQSQQQAEQQSPLNCFLEQLISYRLSSWPSPQPHQAPMVQISHIGEEQQESEKFMRTLLSSASMKEYMLGLVGIQISNSLPLMEPIVPLLHPGLKIINLSGNRLTTPPALSPNNTLQLLNLANNNIHSVNRVPEQYPCLKELHLGNNQVSSVEWRPSSNHPLTAVDLSSNNISSQHSLTGFQALSQLQIVNLRGNPMTSKQGWRQNWNHPLSTTTITTFDNMAAMSLFAQHKDIAFAPTDSSPAQPRTTPSSTQHNTRLQTQQSSISNSSQKVADPQRKNKIHKIKMIEGKVL